MILSPTPAEQALFAAAALAEGAGLTLGLLFISVILKKLRLGRLWRAALQFGFCAAFFALCIYAEIFSFGGTFQAYKAVCFCAGAAACRFIAKKAGELIKKARKKRA